MRPSPSRSRSRPRRPNSAAMPRRNRRPGRVAGPANRCGRCRATAAPRRPAGHQFCDPLRLQRTRNGHRGAGAAGRKAEPGRGADAVELCAPRSAGCVGRHRSAGRIDGHQGRQRRTGRPVRCARIAAVRRRCEHGVAELFGALCRGWHDRRRALGHRRREGRGGGGRARHRCALGQGGRQRRFALDPGDPVQRDDPGRSVVCAL